MMGLAHAAANLATYKALKTPAIQRWIADKIVFRDKPLHPVAAGLVQAFLGPEFYEMHQVGQEKLRGEAAKRLMNSKKYRRIKDVVSHLPLAGFFVGIPIIPDLVAVNNLRYHITQNASPELAQEMMLGTIKDGLEHKNPKKALIKALIFSPAMALAEETAARYARGEKVHLTDPITGEKRVIVSADLIPPEEVKKKIEEKLNKLRQIRKARKDKPIIDRAFDLLEEAGQRVSKKKKVVENLKTLFGRFMRKRWK